MNAHRKTKSASEFEVADKKARRQHGSLQRAGECATVKRQMRRRERRDNKQSLRFGQD